jgi:hypothetical protein
MARDEIPDVPAMLGNGELVIAANKLTDAINILGSDSGHQFETQALTIRRTRRIARALVIGFVVQLIILAGFAFNDVAIVRSEHRIDALTQRLNTAQTVTRQKSLCPLYQLILTAKTPAARAAAPNKAQYDFTFQVIQQGYDALDCAAFTINGAANSAK